MSGEIKLRTVSKDEFEKNYAEDFGMTVDELHRRGLCAEECDCGEEGCQGWAMPIEALSVAAYESLVAKAANNRGTVNHAR